MKKIIKSDLPIERQELPRAEAIKLMKRFKEPYKVQLIEDLPEDFTCPLCGVGKEMIEEE